MAWTIGPSAFSVGPPTAPAPKRSAEAVNASIALLDRLCGAMEVADRQSPSERYDPAAIVRGVGRDPAALLAWVRDQTDWAPYQGALRGPVGVLMDRVGSSLDRSLLLAEFLRLAGHEARLARAQLPPAVAARALANMRPMRVMLTEKAPDANRAQIQALAKSVGVSPETLEGAASGALAEGDRAREEVVQQVAQVGPALATAVGAPANGKGLVHDADRSAAIADHWWVQLHQGRQWIDLDPILPDAKPGQSAARAEHTFPADQLPADQWHRLTLRVVIEQTDGKKLTPKAVFAHDLTPALLHGRSIRLTQLPLDWPTDVHDMQSWKAAGLKQHEWLPKLVIGDDSYYTASFDDAGNVNASPQPNNPMGRSVVGAGKAITGLFDDGKNASAAELCGEWIEYVIQRPGHLPRTIRRELFDLIGPAARARGVIPPAVAWTDAQRLDIGGRLADQIDVLPQVCRIPPRFVSHLTAQALLANRAVLIGWLKDLQSARDARPKGNLKPFPGKLYYLAALRDELGNRSGNLFYDQPNVLTHHSFLASGSAGEYAIHEGFDIVCNDVAVRPVAGGDPWRARLDRGVFDTVAEGVLAGDGPRADNTARSFARSMAAGEKWTAIRTPQDPVWQKAAIPPEARARIAQDLAAGYTVVFPSTPSPQIGMTWWRIDPASGQSLGMGGAGWGDAMVEYATVIFDIMQTALCFALSPTVGGRIACIVGTAVGGMGVLRTKEGIDMLVYMFTVILADVGVLFDRAAE